MQLNLFGESLASAKEKFNRTLDEGGECDCPVCGRFAKVWKRRIHTGIAIQLIELYKLGGYTDYVHTSKLIAPGASGVGDFSKAKYWDLIQEMPEPVDQLDKKSNGYWRLTRRGVDFVLNTAAIQEYAFVYDDTVLKFDGNTVTIEDCLGKKFNYNELWG